MPSCHAASILLSWKANLTDPLGALASWQPDTNPCSPARPWEGVVCTAGGAVAGIKLQRRKLKGQLSGALAGIQKLSEILLAGNEFHGEGGAVS